MSSTKRADFAVKGDLSRVGRELFLFVRQKGGVYEPFFADKLRREYPDFDAKDDDHMYDCILDHEKKRGFDSDVSLSFLLSYPFKVIEDQGGRSFILGCYFKKGVSRVVFYVEDVQYVHSPACEYLAFDLCRSFMDLLEAQGIRCDDLNIDDLGVEKFWLERQLPFLRRLGETGFSCQSEEEVRSSLFEKLESRDVEFGSHWEGVLFSPSAPHDFFLYLDSDDKESLYSWPRFCAKWVSSRKESYVGLCWKSQNQYLPFYLCLVRGLEGYDCTLLVLENRGSDPNQDVLITSLLALWKKMFGEVRHGK